jgi:hypothetical protein
LGCAAARGRIPAPATTSAVVTARTAASQTFAVCAGRAGQRGDRVEHAQGLALSTGASSAASAVPLTANAGHARPGQARPGQDEDHEPGQPKPPHIRRRASRQRDGREGEQTHKEADQQHA